MKQPQVAQVDGALGDKAIFPLDHIGLTIVLNGSGPHPLYIVEDAQVDVGDRPAPGVAHHVVQPETVLDKGNGL